jgi:hypothetical protein
LSTATTRPVKLLEGVIGWRATSTTSTAGGGGAALDVGAG